MTSSARGHANPSQDDIAVHGGHASKEGSPSSEGGQTMASSARETVDASTDIIHLYLTFDTPLPVPDTVPRRDDQPPAPPAPDLSRFADPLSWPRRRKNLMLFLSCIATLVTAYTAGSYAPPARSIAHDLIDESTGAPAPHLTVLAGITTFCFGFALAPMVLAPLSEINGRYPVFVASGVVLVASQAACGAARSLAAMLAARLLTGVGGSVFSTMVGGVIADVWRAEERNTPMALFSGAVLVGTGLGPMIGAEIVGRGARGAWRWVFWHQVIAAAVLLIALVVLFKESRGSILLSRKARALNKWYGEMEKQGYYGVWVEDSVQLPRRGGGGPDSDLEAGMSDKAADGGDEKHVSRRESVATSASLQRIRWKVKSDEERTSIGKVISISVSRPFHLLFTEPVVFFFSLWVSFAWGVLYLTFGGILLVFEVVYGWDIRQAGYVFTAMIVGSIVATAFGILQEQLLRHRNWDANSDVDTATLSPLWLFIRRHLPADAPESRLYFTCLSATLLPAGLFLFGLASRSDSHWIGPTVGLGVATAGIFSVYLATFNYLADVYQTYASSALAAQSCCRNILGGIFPLVTGMLFRDLGPPKAGIVLGSIATVLTLVPWVLVLYGKRIRARSRFAVALERKE